MKERIRFVRLAVNVWLPEGQAHQLRMLSTLDRKPMGDLVAIGIRYVIQKWASNKWPGFLDGSVPIPPAGRRFKEIPRGRPRGHAGSMRVAVPEPPLPPEPLYRQRKRETRRLLETYQPGEIIE